MSTAKAIAGIIPGLQATALLAHNIKVVEQGLKPNKKMTPKKIVKLGVVNLIGISMIKPTAQMVSALD